MFESLIADPTERARHEGAVHDLAHESGLPERDILALYERVLGDLAREARITEFLPLLTRRAVKTRLAVPH